MPLRRWLRLAPVILAQIGLAIGFIYLARLEVAYLWGASPPIETNLRPGKFSNTSTCGYPITWGIRHNRYPEIPQLPERTQVIDRPLTLVSAGLVVVALPLAVGPVPRGRWRRWLAVTAAAGLGGLCASGIDDFASGRVGTRELSNFVPMSSADGIRIHQIEMACRRAALGQDDRPSPDLSGVVRMRTAALGMLLAGGLGVVVFRPWRNTPVHSTGTVRFWSLLQRRPRMSVSSFNGGGGSPVDPSAC